MVGPTDAEREQIREKVRELANLSRDLEMLTRQLSGAVNVVQAGVLKERIDEFTVKQRKLIGEIAACCPDEALKDEFDTLDARLEAIRGQVKESKLADELEELRAEIDPLVDQWAHLFQELVIVTLGGVKAPAEAPPETV